MALVKLLHNPGAGTEEHEKDELISLIEKAGHNCRYSSTKSLFWKNFEEDLDFIIVAGGDGTVRRITKELLDRTVLDKTYPIALLPLGTANNIAKTLGLEISTEEIIASWKNANIKKYDVGRIYNIDKAPFFLESFGYGLFPYLMQEMKNVNKDDVDTPEKKLQTALKLLHKIIVSYEPKQCTLVVDGKDYSGRFILAEVMNTKSIGPNLFLAPDADPGDGVFDVVTISEDDKDKFAAYVEAKINGKEETYTFDTLKAKEVKISWEGSHVHVDDEVVKLSEGEEVSIEMKEGLLQFLVAE